MSRRTFGCVTRRRYKDGSVAPGWYVRYRHPLLNKIVMRRAGDNRTDAEAELARIQKEGPKAPRTDRDLWTFADQTYLPLLETRASPTHVLIRISEYTRAKEWFGEKPMRMISRADMESYLAALARELKPATVVKHRTGLSALWDAAILRRVADENPCKGLRIARVEEYSPPFVGVEQLTAIYDAVEPALRPTVILLGETGMREGEALALRWHEVDDDNKRVAITRSKSGKTRHVDLTPLAQKLITALRAERPSDARPDAPVLPGVNRRRLLRGIKLAAEAAGFPHFRVHDLRHVCATHLVRAGAPVQDVAAMLGHSSPDQVVRRYGRHQPSNAVARAVHLLAVARGQVAPEEKPRRVRKQPRASAGRRAARGPRPASGS